MKEVKIKFYKEKIKKEMIEKCKKGKITKKELFFWLKELVLIINKNNRRILIKKKELKKIKDYEILIDYSLIEYSYGFSLEEFVDEFIKIYN